MHEFMYACTHITHKTHTHTHYPSWVSFTGITTSSSPTPRRHHLKTVSVSHHRCYWLYSKGPFDFRRNQVATNSLYVVLRETSVGTEEFLLIEGSRSLESRPDSRSLESGLDFCYNFAPSAKISNLFLTQGLICCAMVAQAKRAPRPSSILKEEQVSRTKVCKTAKTCANNLPLAKLQQAKRTA